MVLDKELEDWLKKEMFYAKYGSETFKEAQKIWLKGKGKAGFLKRLWWKFSIENNGSLIMSELKPIQEKLIYELIMREDSPKN